MYGGLNKAARARDKAGKNDRFKEIHMDIAIMNRLEASQETLNQDRPTSAMISITDIHAPDNTLYPKTWLKAVLRLKFDDVTKDSEWGLAITDEQAAMIRDFIEQVGNDVQRIIVHCEAGVSRSAGVGAAVMYVLNGDDMPIFQNGKYFPNMTCYKKVLRAFDVDMKEATIKAKERLNRKRWNRWLF